MMLFPKPPFIKPTPRNLSHFIHPSLFFVNKKEQFNPTLTVPSTYSRDGEYLCVGVSARTNDEKDVHHD